MHRDGRKELAEFIVQLTRQVPAFLLLHGQQAPGEMLQSIGGHLQRLFGEYPLRDLVHDEDRPGNELFSVVDGRRRGLNRLTAAVESVDIDQFVRGDLAVPQRARRRPLCRRQPLAGVVSVADAAHPALIARVDHLPAPDATRGRVGQYDIAPAIGHRDAYRQRLEDEIQQLLAPAHRLLHPLAFGDVDVGPVKANTPAGRIANERGAAHKRMDTSVTPHHAELDVARPTFLREFLVSSLHVRTIIGVHRLHVVFQAFALAALVAEEETQVLRGAEDLAVDEIVLPAAGVTKLFGLAQNALALAHRALRAHALGDILIDDDRPYDLAFGAVDGGRRVLNG